LAPRNDDLRWFKSSHSGGNDTCVEVALRPEGSALLRDGTLGDTSPVLRFSPAAWRSFLARVRQLTT
jgi:hypothetical protein